MCFCGAITYKTHMKFRELMTQWGQVMLMMAWLSKGNKLNGLEDHWKSKKVVWGNKGTIELEALISCHSNSWSMIWHDQFDILVAQVPKRLEKDGMRHLRDHKVRDQCKYWWWGRGELHKRDLKNDKWSESRDQCIQMTSNLMGDDRGDEVKF